MREPAADPLSGYPVVIEVPVAWGDMDAFRHVNNTVYFRWFESARIEYFDRVGFARTMESEGIGPILASTRCRFRVPLDYPDTVRIGTRVPAVEDDRFTMTYLAVSSRHQAIAAEGEGLIVSYDYRAGSKAPVPRAVRLAIEALEGHPAGKASG